MDTGGNAGGQASVTIIRGLSLGEITYRDIPRVIWKEIRVAVFCGASLAAANFAKLMLFDRVGLLVGQPYA
jgi:magnesium transporter